MFVAGAQAAAACRADVPVGTSATAPASSASPAAARSLLEATRVSPKPPPSNVLVRAFFDPTICLLATR